MVITAVMLVALETWVHPLLDSNMKNISDISTYAGSSVNLRHLRGDTWLVVEGGNTSTFDGMIPPPSLH